MSILKNKIEKHVINAKNEVFAIAIACPAFSWILRILSNLVKRVCMCDDYMYMRTDTIIDEASHVV